MPETESRQDETNEQVAHPNRDGDRVVRQWKPGDGDLRCQACGVPNVVWYTDPDLWAAVMPNDGILCMGCFIERAERMYGVASWGLSLDPAPFRDEFRRGFFAGLSAQVKSRDGLPPESPIRGGGDSDD